MAFWYASRALIQRGLLLGARSWCPPVRYRRPQVGEDHVLVRIQLDALLEGLDGGFIVLGFRASLPALNASFSALFFAMIAAFSLERFSSASFSSLLMPRSCSRQRRAAAARPLGACGLMSMSTSVGSPSRVRTLST